MVLQTTVEQVEGPVPVTIVALDGELDAASYERVIETVRRVYDAGGRNLLMDLTKPGVHLELRPRRDALEHAADAGRGAARPGAGVGGPARDPGRGRGRDGPRPTSGCAARRTASRRCSTGRASAPSSRPIPIAPPRSRPSDRAAVAGQADAAPSLDRARLERILAPWAARPRRAGRVDRGPAGATIAGRAVDAGRRAGGRGASRRTSSWTGSSSRGSSRPGDAASRERRSSGRPSRPSPSPSASSSPSLGRAEATERALQVHWSEHAANALGIDVAELAKGRRQQRSILSLDRAGRAGLRPRQPLRGGARDRRRLLRAVPPAPARPAARHRDRRRHGQGPRRRPADGLRPAGHAQRAQRVARTGGGHRADEPRPRRGASRHAVHHRCCVPCSSPGPAACASPAPATNPRCSCPATADRSRPSATSGC